MIASGERGVRIVSEIALEELKPPAMDTGIAVLVTVALGIAHASPVGVVLIATRRALEWTPEMHAVGVAFA